MTKSFIPRFADDDEEDDFLPEPGELEYLVMLDIENLLQQLQQLENIALGHHVQVEEAPQVEEPQEEADPQESPEDEPADENEEKPEVDEASEHNESPTVPEASN